MTQSKSLIIVESPAKIKTLKKFLNSDQYMIESSVGHVRDLPEKEFGIDIEHDFEPKYNILPDKEQVIARLKKAAKECDTVYLSPDPDREGEAIAWHIKELLPLHKNIKRVSFNSITKSAVLDALLNPRDIDIDLVNAQQARRLLDRIVGYKISPILNRRIKRGQSGYVSAGRVQSVALKLVVDREKEIMAFIPIEYWNLSALFKTEKEDRSFKAILYSVDEKKVEKELIPGKDVMLINSKEVADSVLERMKMPPYQVVRVERKEKKRNPVPPFITSTLQQEASRHYGFSSSRTMSIAQSLYEGIDLGNEGTEGLITYMRTDSVRIAPEALESARKYITDTFGPQFLPESPRFYSTQKSAQDAHEAIRPAQLIYTPEFVKSFLTKDQFSLYQLIWRRFIASQMVPAIYDTLSADITTGSNLMLRTTGSILKFQGFLIIYEEKVDDTEESNENKVLPPLYEGDRLNLLDLFSEQAFTRPPPRFTEASLVKELEKSGIGRPSTYATIMNKIQSRDYTSKEQGRLKPTELGFVIAQMLEANFQQIMNIGFTAEMENKLEMVAENQMNWKNLLKEFWTTFAPCVEVAEKEAFVPKIVTEIPCPTCGAPLQKVWFKSKYFYGCTRYPECTYTAPVEEISFDKNDYAEDFNWEQKCPKCGKEMKLRHGRYGAFLGCTDYPQCRGIINIPKKGEVLLPAGEMPPCPAIDCPGHMVARRSRFGKTFYSCSTYPECDVIVNRVEDLTTKYPDHPRTAYVKQPKKGAKTSVGNSKKVADAGSEKGSKAEKAPKKAAATKKTKTASAAKAAKEPKKRAPSEKLIHVSKELAEIVGGESVTRADLLKNIWVYIKANNCQDVNNKRLIVPDATIERALGTKEPFDMMKLPGMIQKQIIPEK